MNKKITIGGIEVTISPVEIIMKRAGMTMHTRPGEIDKIKSVIAIVSGFRPLETKPPFINFSPFKVLIDNEGFTLIKQSDETEALNILWEETDTIMTTLDQILSIVLDERKLNPGTRSGGWSPPEKGSVLG